MQQLLQLVINHPIGALFVIGGIGFIAGFQHAIWLVVLGLTGMVVLKRI